MSELFFGFDHPHVISVIAVIDVIAHSRAQSADRAVGMRDNSGAANFALRRDVAQHGTTPTKRVITHCPAIFCSRQKKVREKINRPKLARAMRR